jgi:uncharacterized protein (DUF2252 family)
MANDFTDAPTSAPPKPGSAGLPPLDAQQRALIAQLEGTHEAWQTTGAYEPERPREPLEDRVASGRALRSRLPRSGHAAWAPAAGRPSPVDILVADNAGRQPELVPLRMGRMAASPFAFLRGAAAVMAWDLSHTPVSGLSVLLNGDAHLNNIGLYGTPLRDVIIDLNDFDEAYPGPWEWDLKRLVASVNVAGRENGLDRKERRRAVMDAVEGYRWNVRRLAPMSVLDVWSMFAHAERPPRAIEVPSKAWAIIQRTAAKARKTTNATLLPKVARPGADGGWRFEEDPPVLTRLDGATRAKVMASLVEYAENLVPEYRFLLQRYTVADVAHRVVGVGSVGTRAYLVLLFGHGDGDPLFLQVKEAAVPAHARYLPPFSFRVDHEGRRVVVSQRLQQALGDPLLGWTTIDGRPYYVRQMKNLKASMPVAFLTGGPFDFWAFACGGILARAHARVGDAARIAGYCGKSAALARALAEFAETYGDQTERDHDELVRAVKAGRVEAQGEA